MRIQSIETVLTKDSVLKSYDDVFTGLGKLPGKHHINIDETVPPIIYPPRKVPAAIRDKVKSELDRIRFRRYC